MVFRGQHLEWIHKDPFPALLSSPNPVHAINQSCPIVILPTCMPHCTMSTTVYNVSSTVSTLMIVASTPINQQCLLTALLNWNYTPTLDLVMCISLYPVTDELDLQVVRATHVLHIYIANFCYQLSGIGMPFVNLVTSLDRGREELTSSLWNKKDGSGMRYALIAATRSSISALTKPKESTWGNLLPTYTVCSWNQVLQFSPNHLRQHYFQKRSMKKWA